MPRSGTTLLWSLLPFAYPIGNWKNPTRETQALAAMNPAQNTICKRPKDALELDRIFRRSRRYGVELSVLFCIRDPRSIVTSKHQNVPDDYFMGWKKSYFIPDADCIKPTQTDPGLSKFVQAWVLFSHKPKLLTIRYESLISNPEFIQQKVSNLIGLQPHRKFSDWDSSQTVSHDHGAALNGIRGFLARDELSTRDLEQIKSMSRFYGFRKAIRLLGYHPERAGEILSNSKRRPKWSDRIKAKVMKTLKL